MVLTRLLDLAATRREHQRDQRFGHVWLQSFGVALLQADDVGHDATVFAGRIHVHLGLAWSWQKSPGRIRRILPRSVVDIAGFDVDHFVPVAPRPADYARTPGRGLEQAFVIHLALARFVD